MKKFIVFVVVTIVILAAVIAGIISYVKPAEALDLEYSEVPIGSKIVDIIKNRKLKVELTEQDVNDIVKKQLAARKTLPNDVRIEGAKLTLQGTALAADVNIRWHDKVPVGAKLNFVLAWNNPKIEIQHISTQIKGVNIPGKWLQLAPIEIPLEQHLPKLVGVKDVIFEEDAIQIDLKLLK
ncbi:hypothetical protein [Paenibacillus sedimenti]|uniref:DUF2140 family protein n=1 Tax=Paenibacillus sedimenti TaxID=2770274 RepID=A0A926KWF2_9BACL|nr:hypothetical protein [Paenibacillus sedimenti]MBD0383384.1 hypothetical protein [Paenibacillus sedimenti]